MFSLKVGCRCGRNRATNAQNRLESRVPIFSTAGAAASDACILDSLVLVED